MELLIQLALNLFPAIVAFIAGILWKRLRIAILFFRARQFWRPVMSDDLQMVLGGFGDLEGFEASGLVGRGDVLAMNELTAYFQRIGYGAPRISYGDQVGRNDLTGESLRTNMIIIGGPDANSMTRDVISRIKLGIDFVEVPVDELDQARENSRPRSRLARRVMHTVAATQPSRPWRIPVVRDLTGLHGTTGPRTYRPTVQNGVLLSDYGVIIRAANPFDTEKNVAILCGSYGYGTWAAVRFVQSRKFLNELRKIPDEARTIECVLSVDVVRESPQRPRHEFVRAAPGDAEGHQ